MKNPIKTALASFGMSGQVFHGPSLKINQAFEVIQVLERSKEISKSLFPQAEIVKTYDAILNNAELELVIVNTPDAFHYPMAKQALLAGKHVVVEKPLTQKSHEAEELLSLAKKKGLVFTTYQNRRWDGDFRTVQKVIKEGKLGRLIEFEAHFDRYRTAVAPNTWKEQGNKYSGALYNLGSHMVDQAYVLFGMPKSVTAHLKVVRENGVVNDYYDIRLQYDGFAALLKCSYLVKNQGPRYVIHGEQGTFLKYGIDPQEELLKAGHLPNDKDWGKEKKEKWGTLLYEKNGVEVKETIETIPGDYGLFYDNVYQVIRCGKSLEVEPEQTVNVLQILEACLKSDAEKRTQFL